MGALPNAVALLAEFHANVDARNGNGATPLMVAAGCGNLDIVEVLLEYDAPVEAACVRPARVD